MLKDRSFYIIIIGMKNINILYEDDKYIVVNKPAGLAVQGGKGVKTSLDKILGNIRKPAPLLVHRLDKDTSGVLIAAKTKEWAAYLSRTMEPHSKEGKRVIKQYIAVCFNLLPESGGVISYDLEINGSIKKSETGYKVIKTGKLELPKTESDEMQIIEFSVLEIKLYTGRMHQIRRHLAMNGNPVFGDDKYGNFPLNKKLRKAGHKHLLLHASCLVIDKLGLDIQAPLPEYFSPFI